MMKLSTLSKLCLMCAIAGAVAVKAQTEPSIPLALTSLDTASAVLQPGGKPVQLNFVLDTATVGTESLDVATTDPRVAVSLLLPGGAQLTPATAASLGFQCVTQAVDSDPIARPPLLNQSGTHYHCGFPAGMAPGRYQVQADPKAVTVSSAVEAMLVLQSTVVSAISVGASEPVTGSAAVLTGVLLDAGRPIAGATVHAEVAGPASNARMQLSLLDSGPYDAAPGDGLYTASFMPAGPGEYIVLMRATGLSKSGLPFSRTSSTSFTVRPPSATLGSVTSSAADADGNGLWDQLTVTAKVNVQTAGTYALFAGLQASNGQIVTSSADIDLSAGPGQAQVAFSASDILNLGVNGPYKIVGVTLNMRGSPEIFSGSIADAGSTAAYALSAFDQGSMYFTGTITAAGQDTTNSGYFDVLQATLGVYAPAGQCSWTGNLKDAAGDVIDTFFGGGTFANAGTNTAEFAFSAPKIALSGKTGPYVLTDLQLTCGGNTVNRNLQLSISGFTASQFHNVPPGLTISTDSPTQTLRSGSTVYSTVSVAAVGTFDGDAALTVSGLPVGVSAVFQIPAIPVPGISPLAITAGPRTPPGIYSITITAKSGPIVATATVNLTVTTPGASSPSR